MHHRLVQVDNRPPSDTEIFIGHYDFQRNSETKDSAVMALSLNFYLFTELLDVRCTQGATNLS